MANKIFEAWEKKDSSLYRADLILAAYAERLGYEVCWSPEDEDDTPVDPIPFLKGNKVIWKAVVNDEIVWRCADVVDRIYRNHRSYNTLINALTMEANDEIHNLVTY